MTQGLLTILKNGKVYYKVVCGCDGFEIPKLKRSVRKTSPRNIKELWERARKLSVGCDSCLVVISKSKMYFKGETDDWKRAEPIYRTTYNQPDFNPRWDIGSADYMEKITL